jgi:hypothetical protein
VVEQKYGVWQSKCFNKLKPPSQEELEEICRHIGYRNVTSAQVRTRPDDSKIAGMLLGFKSALLIKCALLILLGHSSVRPSVFPSVAYFFNAFASRALKFRI